MDWTLLTPRRSLAERVQSTEIGFTRAGPVFLSQSWNRMNTLILKCNENETGVIFGGRDVSIGCISHLGAFLPKPGLLVGVRAFFVSKRSVCTSGRGLRSDESAGDRSRASPHGALAHSVSSRRFPSSRCRPAPLGRCWYCCRSGPTLRGRGFLSSRPHFGSRRETAETSVHWESTAGFSFPFRHPRTG